MSSCPAYDQLVAALRKRHHIREIEGLLSWDEQVNLPEGSATFRAEQASILASISHREATSPELAGLLRATEHNASALNTDEHLNVREARKEYDRLAKLTPEFAAEKAALDSEGFHAWLHARSNNDYAAFEPILQRRVELAQREALLVGYSQAEAYDYWLDQFDPGLTCQRLEPLFTELAQTLPALSKEILAAASDFTPVSLTGFHERDQERFARTVIERLGFQFNRGRLDRAPHPFCSGCGHDTRLTTRYAPDQPLDSLFGAIHEAGHGMYEQGLDGDHLGLATGSAAGMAAHESQSRIWENQIARSRAFWSYWEPLYRETFPEALKGVSSEALYRTINHVSLTPIRVDADEVTYNLHILLRFEIERALFSGELDTKDAPRRWNDLASRFFGCEPASNREGILQDIHWAHGAFGYFPSYCLGNLLAAQLWESLRSEIPDWDVAAQNGSFEPLLHCKRQSHAPLIVA